MGNMEMIAKIVQVMYVMYSGHSLWTSYGYARLSSVAWVFCVESTESDITISKSQSIKDKPPTPAEAKHTRPNAIDSIRKKCRA